MNVKMLEVPYSSVAVNCSMEALYHVRYYVSCYRDCHCNTAFVTYEEGASTSWKPQSVQACAGIA